MSIPRGRLDSIRLKDPKTFFVPKWSHLGQDTVTVALLWMVLCMDLLLGSENVGFFSSWDPPAWLGVERA